MVEDYGITLPCRFTKKIKRIIIELKDMKLSAQADMQKDSRSSDLGIEPTPLSERYD